MRNWTWPFPSDVRPTVLREVYLARCEPARYAELANFHYRGHQLPSGITHVFGAFLRGAKWGGTKGGIKGSGSRFDTNSLSEISQPTMAQQDPVSNKRLPDPFCHERASDRLIGIVLYGLCPVRHHMRGAVFRGRYRLGGMRQGIQRLNREMRTIRRVVVDPQFRGIGLAWRMVQRTLPLVGTPYVEASAAMGRVNPFFVRAGMRHYAAAAKPADERLLAAWRATGFDTQQITSVGRLKAHLDALDEPTRTWLLGEVRRFNKRFQQIGRPPETWCLERALERVARNAGTRPDYFVWENPKGAVPFSRRKRDCPHPQKGAVPFSRRKRDCPHPHVGDGSADGRIGTVPFFASKPVAVESLIERKKGQSLRRIGTVPFFASKPVPVESLIERKKGQSLRRIQTVQDEPKTQSPTVQWVDTDRLIGHPLNANQMPAELLDKLETHIRDSGRYPPLIVRMLHASPQAADWDEGTLQVIDGHHRLEVLRRLGHKLVRVDCWGDLTDAETELLLATLNRLEGSDDAQRRAGLIESLRSGAGLDNDRLAELLPESVDALAALQRLKDPPPLPERTAPMLVPVTVFVTPAGAKIIRGALRRATEQTDTQDGTALTHICESYLHDSNPT